MNPLKLIWAYLFPPAPVITYVCARLDLPMPNFPGFYWSIPLTRTPEVYYRWHIALFSPN